MFRTFFILAVTGAACCAAWAQNLPGMAEGVIQQSDLARKAVSQHDSAAALDHIQQGTILADEILKAAPPQPKPVLVQVYKNIDTTSTYAPVKRRASDQLDDRLKKNTSIRDVQGNITIGKLDVTSAATRLAAAGNAVERADWVTADSQLGAIPGSIIRTSVEGSMPLLEARQNLELAQMRVLEFKFKDAKAPLRTAAEDLANYEKLYGAHATDVEYLREQIDAYAQRIGHDHANAANRINAWLQPIDKWNQEVGG
jgi:hypothetical protein